MARPASENGRGALSLQEVAERTGVSPATLRRWTREGLIPHHDGNGVSSPAAVGHARIAAMLRERGHSLVRLKGFTESTEIFLARQAEAE